MTDEIELECISQDELDVCADPPTPGNARTSAASDAQESVEQYTATTGQGTRRDLQGQGSASRPVNDATESAGGLALQSPPQARAELDPTNSPPRDRVQGRSTAPSAARNHRSSTQLEAGNTPTHGTRRQERVLIDDPPPAYSDLSSSPCTWGPHSQPLHIQQRHPHHSPMHATSAGYSHIAAQQHNTMPLHNHQLQHQYCSLIHGNSNCHHSVSCTQCVHGYHHPEILLPGEVQPYTFLYPSPGQPPHPTVLPSHYHGSNQEQNSANDYLILSFVCVVLCTLHLNILALFCVLPALGYSIKAHHLNNERMVRRASIYGRAALLCNLLAFCQYVICSVAVVAAFVLVIWG